jgi:oligosaccharide:H+ symporter
MNEKTLNVKLLSVYFIVFGALACYYPFLAVYFGERGLSYSQIGVAFAVNSMTAVLCQPIWGYFTDKYLGKVKTIIIGALGSCVAIYALVFSDSFLLVLVSIFLFMAFQSPVTSVTDAYCYEIIDHHKSIQYGRIRLWGSLGYAVIALIVGAIIKHTGTNTAFVIYSIVTVFGVAILNSIGFKSKHSQNMIRLKDISELFKNKKFVVFMISVVLANIALGANGSYIAVLIEKTGGDASKLGMLWFIVAISELPVFFLGNRLIKKYGILNLYLLSLALYIFRFFLDSFATNYIMVIIIQVMQSITFALYLLSALQYLNTIIPNKMKATGMTIYAALGGGLGGFIGNIFGGLLLEVITIFSLFKILAVVVILALAVGVVLKRMK